MTKLEEIENNINKRNKMAPFQEGVYSLGRYPFNGLTPRLRLRMNKKQSKVKARLFWFSFQMPLWASKYKNHRLVLVAKVDIFDVDMVLDFSDRAHFLMLIDTPLGHIRLHGQYLKRCEVK